MPIDDDPIDDWRAERERLVAHLLDRGRIERDSTAAALRAVPRHAFVPPVNRDQAYADRPLPIGADQTISAPHMVGRMTDLLNRASDDRVLEIGTDCGYHAAVTAEIADEVRSVEYRATLARKARDRLDELGYENVAVRVGDGHDGYLEGAPYDAAYLTCAAGEIPPPVVAQVRPGGRIIAPPPRPPDARKRHETAGRLACARTPRERPVRPNATVGAKPLSPPVPARSDPLMRVRRPVSEMAHWELGPNVSNASGRPPAGARFIRVHCRGGVWTPRCCATIWSRASNTTPNACSKARH